MFIVTQNDEPCELVNGMLAATGTAQVFQSREDAERAIQDSLRWVAERGYSIGANPNDPDENGIAPKQLGYTYGGFRIIALK